MNAYDDGGDGASPGPLDANNTPSAARNAHGLHLACRECQRKKIKCDRHFPCGRCARSNLPCVPSSRKPRAKVGIKAADAELRQRIAKLEKLVESFQGEGDDERGSSERDPSVEARPSFSTTNESLLAAERRPSSNSPQSPQDAPSPASNKTNKYIAGTFWASLTSEVKALADALEEDGQLSDEETPSPDQTPEAAAPYPLDPTQSGPAGFELIFCPPGALYIMPGALQDPHPAMASQLLDNFYKHVEPLNKLFHIPTLKAFLENGQYYLGKSPDAPCNKALRAAVYFAAINAFTPDECLAKFGKPCSQLVQEYKRVVDITIYQMDPLNTTDIAALQALCLYAASIRVSDSSRRAWSLVGLLVRLARAMSIHRELQGESPFLAELRRRLWYNVVFLDCYASLDRGSESALHPDLFSRLLPTNCNDADFDEYSTQVPSREGEITDMSLALIAQEGSMASLRIASANLTWQRRLEISYEYQRKINERFLRHCNPDIPFHKVMSGTATAICHSLILRSVRPIEHDSLGQAPRVDSPWVMQLALNLLRHSHHLWLYNAGGWRKMPWVPWHAIAVTLAGLCSIRGTEMAAEAWDLVEKAMSRYGPDVADSQNGMLWRPIEKLHKKALLFRGAGKPQVPPPLEFDPATVTISSYPNNNNDDRFVPKIPQTPGSMILDPMSLAASDAVFNFPPDAQLALPNDTSWLDWEAMMKDMDDIKADDMQWY